MDESLDLWWKKQNEKKIDQLSFSEFADNYLPPAHYVGKLKDIKCGEPNPYYITRREDSREKKTAIIPKKFDKLRDIIPTIYSTVWYYEDIPITDTVNEGLFELVMYEGLDIGGFISVIYGEKSGILCMEIRSWSRFICDIPKDFNFNALVRLLRSDLTALNDFVLKYGRINEAQAERIKKYGI